MKILVAGATGAIGTRLVPVLVRAGHTVIGTTRTAARGRVLRDSGAKPLILDALDRDAVLAAVQTEKPDVLVHQLTAIPPRVNLRKFDREFALTNRLRTEGTDHLITAARVAAVRRVVAQSFAGLPYAREGGPVKTEEDPLDSNPPAALRRTVEAIRHLETAVLGAEDLEGVVLRYGALYGPGTSLGAGGSIVDDLRRRRFPLVGDAAGVWSFLHVEDAASATLVAIERAAPGLYNIVDDEPAPVSEWLPALASAVGARPPQHVPRWLARLVVGEHGIVLMCQIRGASNAKARHTLGWRPTYFSWREGFLKGLGDR